MRLIRSRTGIHSAAILLNFHLHHILAGAFAIPSFVRRQKSKLFSIGVPPSTQTCNMRQVDGIRDIIDEYDVFLLDMWGVMHDGSKPYDGVLEVVQRLHEAGKRLIILSNSSKRRDSSVSMLQKLGFDPDSFEQIITSGEISYQMLRSNSDEIVCEPWSPLLTPKKTVFVLGSGDGDADYCRSSGWRLSSLEDASLILARGTFTVEGEELQASKRNDEKIYGEVLNDCLLKSAKLKLPMLISNPDKVRPDAERPPMPGKIGDDYVVELKKQHQEEVDGLVKRIGKPFPDVYQVALREVADRSRVCMIGDALETDVTGGQSFGIDTVWVMLDGIHAPDLDRTLSLRDGAAKIIETYNGQAGTYSSLSVSPTFLMPHLKW